ncbi:MAG: hypothetical protein GF308_19245 [Candidatus Heimdallarchaeota archaeon]|nr:hypothetical protein [Candidatus Heimdallarchaeota archaeon]
MLKTNVIRKITVLIVIILCHSFLLSSTFSSVNGVLITRDSAFEPQRDNQRSEDVSFNFTRTFNRTLGNSWELASELDLPSHVESIDSFVGEGISAFVGDQEVTSIDESVHRLSVQLDSLTIYDDHDTLLEGEGESGEIFCEIFANGFRLKTAEYEANDETNPEITLNLPIFNDSWCFYLNITIAIFDKDTFSGPDSLGTFNYYTANPTTGQVSEETDLGDAEVHLSLELLEGPKPVTADQLAEGSFPYFPNDEPDNPAATNGIYSRVLVGFDSTQNKEVVCIQYIFYWAQEKIFGQTLHEDDYEELLIFLDPDNLQTPYRYVFENAGIFSQQFAILEYTPASNTTDIIAPITPELTPFLGYTTNLSYAIVNLNSETDKLRLAPIGISTLNLQVKNSFHHFETTTYDGFEEALPERYDLQPLNNSLLRFWFQKFEEALEEGVFWIDPLNMNTPIITPFTIDVMNPFQKPYIVTGYPNVVEDTDAFETALDNKQMTVNSSITGEVTFSVKARYTITTPPAVFPGDVFQAQVRVEMIEDETAIALGYQLAIDGSIKLLFLNKCFTSQYGGLTLTKLPTSQTTNNFSLCGLDDFLRDDLEITNEDFFSTDYVPGSTIVGDIQGMNVSLHLWDMLKTVLPMELPQASVPVNLLDHFIELFDLQVATSFDGYLQNSISSSNSTLAFITSPTSFLLEEAPSEQLFNINVSASAKGNETFQLIIDQQTLSYSLLAEWDLPVIIEDLVGLIDSGVRDQSMEIGTFPDVAQNSTNNYQITSEPITILSEPHGSMAWYTIVAIVGGVLLFIIGSLYLLSRMNKRRYY